MSDELRRAAYYFDACSGDDVEARGVFQRGIGGNGVRRGAGEEDVGTKGCGPGGGEKAALVRD